MPPLKVDAKSAGVRLDVWLAQRFPDYSRAFLQKWVKAGRVLVQGKLASPSESLRAGDLVDVTAFQTSENNAAPEARRAEPALEGLAEPQIIFEDGSLLILNKPAGLVVHPAPSYQGLTLIDWLRRHLGGRVAKQFTDPERLGLVHRLDKDTSGVLVIAKSVPAQVSLARQFQERSVQKTYMAWVHGIPASPSGIISAPVGRSRKDPTRMAVIGSGRPSETAFTIEESLKEVSLLMIRPKTGRTHQIRVHMAALGHPIVGDITYGADAFLARRYGVARPLLHAQELAIQHPQTKNPLRFEAKPPADFRAARAAFRKAALALCGLLFLNGPTPVHAAKASAATEESPAATTPTSTPKPHHKATAGSGVSSVAFRQARKEIIALKEQNDALQAQYATMKQELEGIEAGLTQLDAARRLRDLERALPDMNAKLTTAANNADDARAQAADTTRKMRSLEESIEQFRDQLDHLQRQLIEQRAKQEDAQIRAPQPPPTDATGKIP